MLETWIVFDTETSNLVGADALPLARQPHVIEFGAVLISLDAEGEGEELEALEFLCEPPTFISDEITKITGIKATDLIGKGRYSARAADVAALFEKATHRAAHNLTFDEHMLNYESERCGIEWVPRMRRQRRICTVEASEWFMGRRSSLSDLHERLFDTRFESAHRALVDVRATARVVRALRKRGMV